MGLKDKNAYEKALKEATRKYRAAARKYRTKRNLFKIIFGYCPCCGRYFRWSVKTELRNTQYNDPASNWLTACKECQEEDDAYFSDLWSQYYSSIL